MAFIYYIFMFGLGLILLVWGSNLFVDSAILLANRFHVSEVLIGATIVSLGTTLPETLFSAMASIRGLSDMAIGNALGSVLCNTGLIAGMLLLLKPIRLDRQSVKSVVSGVFFLGAAFLVYVMSGMAAGGLTRAFGVILLVICGAFVFGTVQDAAGAEQGRRKEADVPPLPVSEIIRIPLEVAAIFAGANLLVNYGPKLAGALGIPEIIISLTFVALGTSLPELVTSLAALKKQHSSLSLGNIIGADILNFVLVGGLSAVISPIAYPESLMKSELPFAAFLLLVLCIPSVLFKKAGRAQGIFLVGGYILYLVLMLGH